MAIKRWVNFVHLRMFRNNTNRLGIIYIVMKSDSTDAIDVNDASGSPTSTSGFKVAFLTLTIEKQHHLFHKLGLPG